MIFQTFFSPPAFFFPSFFFKSLPFPHEPCLHSRLSTVSVNTDTCFCRHSLFFYFRFPLSWQCSLLGMQEGDCQAAKSYTDKNKGVFLFVSFATLSYPPSHPSSGMIFFSSLFSWSCLHRFHADFVIGYRLASWAAHTLTISLSWSGIFSDLGPGT